MRDVDDDDPVGLMACDIYVSRFVVALGLYVVRVLV